MLNTVVVGVDGSEASRAALRWVGEHSDGDVHTVYAVSPAFELLEAGFQIDTTARMSRAREQLEHESTADDTLPSGRASCHVIEDRISRALLSTAGDVDADAVVIGANGRERIGGVVGANAARLIHECHRPLVIVPAGEDDRGSSDGPIVVAVSGDTTRDRQLLEWARRFGGKDQRLTVVYSLAPQLSHRQGASDLEAAAAEHLNQLLEDSTTDDEIVISLHDPLTAIIDNSATAPLTVIGSHHSRRIEGFLAGAIAQHLPAVSPCAVALIPLTDHD